METQKSTGLVKATLVLGVLTLVFALLPLLSGWFLLLMWLTWILGPAAIICGVIALVKKQYDMKKTIIGLVLVVAAFVLPRVMEESYVKSAGESAGRALKGTMELTKSLNE
jgi:hypothetical protein